MRAGALNYRVELQRPTNTKDGEGTTVVTWTPLATVWAAVEPQAGREFVEGQQLQNVADVRVRIRYRPDVTAHMRVQYRARTFEILGIVDPLEAHRELQLTCIERHV